MHYSNVFAVVKATIDGDESILKVLGYVKNAEKAGIRFAGIGV